MNEEYLQEKIQFHWAQFDKFCEDNGIDKFKQKSLEEIVCNLIKYEKIKG